MEYMLTFHKLNVYVDKTQPHQSSIPLTYNTLDQIRNRHAKSIAPIIFLNKLTTHYYISVDNSYTYNYNIMLKQKHDMTFCHNYFKALHVPWEAVWFLLCPGFVTGLKEYERDLCGGCLVDREWIFGRLSVVLDVWLEPVGFPLGGTTKNNCKVAITRTWHCQESCC